MKLKNYKQFSFFYYDEHSFFDEYLSLYPFDILQKKLLR
jgi:hypothetical protein